MGTTPNSNRSQASGQTRTVALADRMRLTQLKLVMVLGEDGTLGRAAATINVTQATATKMLAEFEAILGVTLYERRPRGLHATAPWADIAPFARALAAVRPDRVVWGSNWPHPIRFREMPDDGDLLDALAEWLPDPLVLQQVLVDNPTRLYGFSAPSRC